MESESYTYQTSDRDDFQTAMDGWKWKKVCLEMDNRLRNVTKHSDDDIAIAAQYWRDVQTEIMNEEGVTLYD